MAMQGTDGHQTILKYSDETKENAIREIEGFAADFGGTDILGPLMKA